MGIDWYDVFQGIGRGMESFGGYLVEQERDEREEQQAKERADYANQLEKEREASRREFAKKLAEDTAKMQSSLRMKEKETGYVFDTFGIQLGREYTQVMDLPIDDPNRQEVLGKISFATNMLAEAKGGKTDFTSEELDMLPADFRVNFTGTILANKRFNEQQELASQIAESQMQLRQAQAVENEARAKYYADLKEAGQPVDQLKAQKERQRQLGIIDQIKSSDYYRMIQRALAEGQSPENIARENPVMWNSFLRGEMMIREANAIAIQQGLLSGMTPEDLGLIKPEVEPEPEPGGKKKKEGIDPLRVVKSMPRTALKVKEELSPGLKSGRRVLEKAIAPITARGKAVDRALTIGLKAAQKKYGASVMSYEQAMDLKENRPGQAKGQRFVAIDPTSRKVAVFEFYIKNGKLAAKKVE